MAKNDFPKTETKDAFGVHGHAKENKSASAYTGFVYPEGGGNDIGIYKQPMSVPEKHAIKKDMTDKSGNPMAEYNISVAGTNKGLYKGINPTGVGEMRGYGAATKGRKISGKMG
jgi:hypothetical protein